MLAEIKKQEAKAQEEKKKDIKTSTSYFLYKATWHKVEGAGKGGGGGAP